MVKCNMLKRFWLSLCIIIFILFSYGCPEDEVPTQPSKENSPFIMGSVSKTGNSAGIAYCSITGDPVPAVDSILVNSAKLEKGTDVVGGLDSWYSLDSMEVNPGNTYTLSVYHSEGEATASVTLAEEGDLNMVFPETNQYIVPRDSSDLVLIWNSVENVGYYIVSYEFYCSWSTGAHWCSGGFIALDTTYAIKAEDLLYLGKDTITAWSGKIGISPMIGPGVQEGDSGNVVGEGCGFWWGGCELAQIDLQLEGVTLSTNALSSYENTDEESMKDILIELKEQICNW
jgi:hypothetical protein